MGIIIILIIAVLVFLGYRNYKETPASVASHWSHFFPGLSFSAQDFYAKVEESINQAEVPNAKFSRVTYAQTGLFSARREYFRVARNEFVFDICAAPFGTGFFVSWWLAETNRGLIARIPVVKTIFGEDRENKTYYQADTEAMFRQCVHSAVMQVIDDITSGKGIRGMTELERQAK